MPQAGTVYRYLRADADHDISAKPIAISLDGTTWITTGITYVAVGSLPPGPAAVHAANPPAAGFTGYWFRILTGPSDIPLANGPNRIRGRITDSLETPHFIWTVHVAYGE